jgi:hypothetical protein
MQRDYRYRRIEMAGKNVAPNFYPEPTPKQMLAPGDIGGKYMTVCTGEGPVD